MTRRARLLHPGAWWLWALSLAVAASRTTNPLLLLLIITVAGYVVAARKPIAPWGRSFGVFLRIGLVIIAIRMVFQMFLGAPIGTTVLIMLPSVTLPEVLAGVRLGGAVTLESMLAAFYDGLRLATILACIGAANSLASPARLLKAVPAALYEVGVAIVIAITFAPQLIADLDRIRSARRLRGRPVGGVRGTAGSAMPVLEGALDRSIALAAAMDSRGYGRRADQTPAARRTAAIALLAGLVAALVGSYGLLDATAPPLLGLPLIVVGAALAIGGIGLAGRRSTRTRYRPDAWDWAEWGVTACGLITAAGFIVAGAVGLSGLVTPADPPTWPALPLALAAVTLVSLLPAWIAPPLPRPRATVVRRDRMEVTA